MRLCGVRKGPAIFGRRRSRRRRVRPRPPLPRSRMVANFLGGRGHGSYQTRYRDDEPAESDRSCTRRLRSSSAYRPASDRCRQSAGGRAVRRCWLDFDESGAAWNPRDQRTRTRRQIDGVNRPERTKDMKKQNAADALSTVPADPQVSATDGLDSAWNRVVGRRAFLKGVGVTGAAVLVPAALTTSRALAAETAVLTHGDVAILRFLAAAELIEADLWQQYNELGGVDGGNSSYQAALSNLDGDMPQYIADNTDDEMSHAAFLNAYLESMGAEQVNLDAFRTLPSSKATGAQQIGRLTNLQKLNVDTSWYTRYRSTQNPDLGATFPQAITIKNEPAIPLNDTETPPGTSQPVPPDSTAASRMQAIANTAGFHFAYIEQGGASLYTSLSLKVSSLEVLRIVVRSRSRSVGHARGA